MTQRHPIYCALHSCHYSSSPSAHRALDPGGWDPVSGDCSQRKECTVGAGSRGRGGQAESLAEGTQASRRQDGGAPTAGSLAFSFLTPPGFSLPLLLRANDTEDSRRPWTWRMRVGWSWRTRGDSAHSPSRSRLLGHPSSPPGPTMNWFYTFRDVTRYLGTSVSISTWGC